MAYKSALLLLLAAAACHPESTAESADAGPANDASHDAAIPHGDAPPAGTENTDAQCSNGIDDDGDGYIDCDDFDCARNPAVTVCNPEFWHPLPTPIDVTAPFSSPNTVGAVAIAWSATNRLFVGAGVASGIQVGTQIDLFIADGHLLELDPNTGATTSAITTEPSSYVAIGVSPDGHFVAAGTAAGGHVDIADMSGAAPVVTPISNLTAIDNRALAFSADSRWLYAGGAEYSFEPPMIRRYDLANQFAMTRSAGLANTTEILELQTLGTSLYAFTDNARVAIDPSSLVAGSALYTTEQSPLGVAVYGEKWRFYAANDLDGVAIPGAQIVDVAFDPDYRTAAVLQQDGTLRLVDTISKIAGTPVQAHTGLGSKVAFSPDGSMLVTTGINPAVAIFHLR